MDAACEVCNTAYRGYNIRLAPDDRNWRVHRRHSFVVSASSEDEALAEIKRQIDRLLSLSQESAGPCGNLTPYDVLKAY
jgi:hypothetical protein